MSAKQKRLRKQSVGGAEEKSPPALDPDFDGPDKADVEFTAWRWPERR